MKIYPSSPLPTPPIEVRQKWKTDITAIEGGKEFRRARWLFPKREFVLKYENLTHENIEIFWNFYKSVKGAYESFWYKFPIIEQHEEEYLGTGDGANREFFLPSSNANLIKIYINSNPLSASDFTVTTNADEGRRDKITLNAAPAAGEIVTADFLGKLILKVRFKDDIISKQMFKAYITSVGITLVEVR